MEHPPHAELAGGRGLQLGDTRGDGLRRRGQRRRGRGGRGQISRAADRIGRKEGGFHGVPGARLPRHAVPAPRGRRGNARAAQAGPRDGHQVGRGAEDSAQEPLEARGACASIRKDAQAGGEECKEGRLPRRARVGRKEHSTAREAVLAHSRHDPRGAALLPPADQPVAAEEPSRLAPGRRVDGRANSQHLAGNREGSGVLHAGLLLRRLRGDPAGRQHMPGPLPVPHARGGQGTPRGIRVQCFPRSDTSRRFDRSIPDVLRARPRGHCAGNSPRDVDIQCHPGPPQGPQGQEDPRERSQAHQEGHAPSLGAHKLYRAGGGVARPPGQRRSHPQAAVDFHARHPQVRAAFCLRKAGRAQPDTLILSDDEHSWGISGIDVFLSLSNGERGDSKVGVFSSIHHPEVAGGGRRRRFAPPQCVDAAAGRPAQAVEHFLQRCCRGRGDTRPPRRGAHAV
mmetsp:Transcript_38780/g.123187  ORF Transcript_38780/g.123187 Transcript_38780/m.123187 type:complete len:454 (+) Transcript_38780:2055-3416(+)